MRVGSQDLILSTSPSSAADATFLASAVNANGARLVEEAAAAAEQSQGADESQAPAAVYDFAGGECANILRLWHSA